MTTILNNYAGPCCNCGGFTPNTGADRGFAVKGNDGKWSRYCKTCVPVKISVDRKLTSDGRLYLPFERENLDLIRSIPGAWFDRNEVCWKVSLKEGDRDRLIEICHKLKVEVAPELCIVSFTEQGQNAERSGLYEFQVDGVDWLSKGDKRLLADDMGLGKTVQTLMALPKDCAAMAIVPSSLKYNWQQEANKWRPDLKATVLNGGKSFRLPAFGEIVIVNYDILPEYVEPKKISATSKSWEVQVNWPSPEMSNHAKNIILIIDEAHRVKNYKAKRSKRVKGLCMSASRVWALTGTPLENRPQDLFGILETLQMQMKVFGGWNKFVKYMNGYQDGWGGYVWGAPNPIVPELLRRVMLRRKRKDVLPDLPDKSITYIKVPLPNELKNHMDNLWSKHGKSFKTKELPPFEEFSEIRQKLAASRVDSLVDLVEDHEEDDVPLVVFSAHLEPLDKLGERDGWAKITGSTSPENRQKVVNEFQAGKLKGVAVSIRAGGVGLTLTRAWKAIFVDLDWVPGANQQAEDRICRIGQTSNKCEIVRMVSDHPLDLHVLELIQWKMGLIEKSIENVIVPNIPAITVSETDENFESRMSAASYMKKSERWLPHQADAEIPF
jgi:SWI/SNF-related matrix-associated actin-dependent regulator 1 of chromatin subfamily A